MTNQEAIQKLKEALSEGIESGDLIIRESHRRIIYHIEYMDKILRDRELRIHNLEQAIINQYLKENSND